MCWLCLAVQVYTVHSIVWGWSGVAAGLVSKLVIA